MKISLVFIAAFMSCFQLSQALFSGSKIVLPQNEELVQVIFLCTNTTHEVITKLRTISKKSHTFAEIQFDDTTKALTQIQYTFQNINEFYSYFLKSSVDKPSRITGETTMRNIKALIHQLNTFILPGLDTKFVEASEVLGDVYGITTRSIFLRTSKLYIQGFTNIAKSLETINDKFETFSDANLESSIPSLQIALGSEAFASLLNTFKNIEVTTYRFSTIVDNLLSVTSSLEDVIKAIEKSYDFSHNLIHEAMYDRDLSVVAAEKALSKSISERSNNITAAFEDFKARSHEVYVGDEEVQSGRDRIDSYTSTMKLYLVSSLNRFTEIFSENQIFLTEKVETLYNGNFDITLKLKKFFENSLNTSTPSVQTCFKGAVIGVQEIIRDYGYSASSCIESHREVPGQARSLMTFIIDDVLMEAKAAASRLCSCVVVQPTAKTLRRGKNCIRKVANFIVNELAEDEKKYLERELENLHNVMLQTQDSFRACSDLLSLTFAARVENFRDSLSSCLVG